MVTVCFPYTDAMTRSSEAPGLRETILAISGELLNEGGPASLSMREVSRRAGCTHQAPYHHFKSREGILAALITEGFLALEKSLSEALRASAGATPQETTRASGHAYLTFALKNSGVFRIMFRSDMYDPNSHPELIQASQAARSQLHGLAKIAYGSEDPHAEATLWAYIHGLAILVLAGPPALGTSGESSTQQFAHGCIDSPFFIDGVPQE